MKLSLSLHSDSQTLKKPTPSRAWRSLLFYIIGKWQPIHDKAGNGWASSPDILRRLLTLCFKTHRNLAKIRYCCLELSNGRCPRV